MWVPCHNMNQPVVSRLSLLAVITLLSIAGGCTSFAPYPNAQVVQNRDTGFSGNETGTVQDVPDLAAHSSFRAVVSAPEPFAWKREADSAGGRPIQAMTVGRSGYRTLVIGNLGGNDPLAVALTEQLAEYLHSNSLILGGIQTTVVRNANPDGLASRKFKNDNDVYLNRQFPGSEDDYSPRRALGNEPEVRFILGQIDELQPQRILHIRTYHGEEGVIASSSEAMEAAADVAEWLRFDHRPLPGNSKEGTLERYISSGHSRQIITVAIPDTSKQSRLWQLHGDALLNLLLSDDYATRALAREFSEKSSADNRNRKPAFAEPAMPRANRMFPDDLPSSNVEDLPTLP